MSTAAGEKLPPAKAAVAAEAGATDHQFGFKDTTLFRCFTAQVTAGFRAAG
jgi:hypothetical protein